MWADMVLQVAWRDERKLALLMALMWKTAADRGDPALLSNLRMNTLDPLGVANALDWAGIQAPGTEQRDEVLFPMPGATFPTGPG